jgi:hypothetical protein
VQSQSQLFEVVFALRAAGCFASLLYGGQQQCDQNRDDGDHHQQFDQSESPAGSAWKHDGAPENGSE